MRGLSICWVLLLVFSACSKKEKQVDLGKRPLLEGLSELKFGTKLEAIKSNPDLQKRCQGEMRFSRSDPRNPDQKIEEWAGYCIAEVAGRFAKMGIHFDHNNELHLIFFMFGRSPSDDRVKKLETDQDRKAFAKEVRALLSPGLGEPQVRPGKAVKLSWYGRTADQPPHATEVNLDLDPVNQTISWEDTTRYDALEAALEKERTARTKKKGI